MGDKEKAKKMANRIKDVPCCPNCGHSAEEGVFTMSDWCLSTGSVIIKDGKMVDADITPTELYKDEDMIRCPKCDEDAKAEDWGLEWA